MARMLLALLLACASAALGFDMPNPLDVAKRLERFVDMNTDCTGSADPDASSLPICYKGTGTVLGLQETITINLKTFDNEKGTVDLIGEGVVPIHCTDESLTKTGQDLSVYLGHCVKNLDIKTLKYCSDSDTVVLSVQQSNIPIPVDAVLKRVDCSML